MSASDWDGILRNTETVLWQGKPDDGVFLEASRRLTFFTTAAMFVIGLFMAIAVLVMSSGQKNGPDWVFALFFFVFLLFSGGLALGQLYWPAYKRRHTFYTLTSQRAILGVDLPFGSRRLQTYDINADQAYEYRPTAPGAPGSIVFEYRYSGIRVNKIPQTFAVGMMYVHDVETAWNKLREVQRNLTQKRPERGANA